MSNVFLDYYRCPEGFGHFALAAALRAGTGYFRFGRDVVCFGQCTSGYVSRNPEGQLFDSYGSVSFNQAGVCLPFDPNPIIDNLRLERYQPTASARAGHRAIRRGYYSLRPHLGLWPRKQLQKLFLRGWEDIPFPRWPVDTTTDQLLESLMVLSLKSQSVKSIPFIWFWPEGASSCVAMTHDVETEAGAGFCSTIMDIDDAWGIKSSFQIVPEDRYPVTEPFLNSIRQRGFEIGVQDLNHDGHLFDSREEFLVRAAAINKYAQAFGSRGFRAAVMYRNPDWYDALDISYDMSIPNVAHLEPQRGGCCTVFPYLIGDILEIPLTMVQDYSLFHILNQYSIELWQHQIAMVQQRHGLVSFIVHPDYVIEKRAQKTYVTLLEYLAQLRDEGNVWTALPSEIDSWWRERSQMQLVAENGCWSIQGPGSERARIGFAALEGDNLVYGVSNEARLSCAV